MSSKEFHYLEVGHIKNHHAKEAEKLQSIRIWGKPRQKVSSRPSVYTISGKKKDSEQTVGFLQLWLQEPPWRGNFPDSKAMIQWLALGSDCLTEIRLKVTWCWGCPPPPLSRSECFSSCCCLKVDTFYFLLISNFRSWNLKRDEYTFSLNWGFFLHHHYYIVIVDVFIV